MRRALVTALATATMGLGMATPAMASATLTQCPNAAGCVTGTTNVNLQGNVTDPGALIIKGNVGPSTGPEVDFTSTQGFLDAKSGDATIFLPNGAVPLTQLTFTLLGGASFTSAEFNLDQGILINSDNPLVITLTALGGGTSTFNVTKPTGGNVFDIVAGTGESYTSASFSTTNGGFTDFKQLRLILASTTAVPEPATWAMMLLGFGGIGAAMRRSRRRKPALMQVA